MVLSSYMDAESTPESMDAREWARVRRILHHALELAPPLRPGYLDEACEGDPSLRAEVESLLAAAEKSAMLDRSLVPSLPATVIVETMPAGRKIGQYRVVEKIGEGGMGAVYKAIDTRLDRPVALKVVTGARGDWKQERRFAREAKAASALNHPNIVTIYEFDTQDGLDFIAMEYVQGTTLKRLLEQHTVPLETLLDYARQAAGAIAKAHAAGIVHRDLKPANIMVTADGVVKVLDFGLAKLHKSSTDPDSTETQALTMAGTSVGTPSYMSPEQAKGEPEDSRTDIFSFGVILYEVACGRRPFHGRTTHATMYQIVHEEPPSPATLNPVVTPELALLIAKCLRKDRAERVQAMDEVAAALAQLASSTRPATGALSRRSWLASGAGIAATALAAGLWLSHTPQRVIDYTLDAQRYRNGEPAGEIYAASPADTFEGGWKFRLRVRAAQPGFLYVINEGPGDSGTSRYWVLYPAAASDAPLRAGQETATGWYVFDRNPGTEKVWIVWSEHPGDAIEEVLRGNTQGEVRGPAQASRIRDVLAGLKRPAESAAPGLAGAVQWRAAGGALGGAIELRHR